MKVKYTAPFLEPSGYGNAARWYAKALDLAGVDVTLENINYNNMGTVGLEGMAEFLYSKFGVLDDWDVHIVHAIPPDWKNRIEHKDRPMVGYTVWETDRLHPAWKYILNNTSIQNFWVPTNWSADVFRQHTDKPVTVIPHVVPEPIRSSAPLSLPRQSPDVFTFYSIFQWSERKHAAGMLAAYFSEFDASDPVSLVLKTHHDGTPRSKQIIIDKISRLRKQMGKISFPAVMMVHDMLSNESIEQIHNTGDCYLSLHRGEGWGLTITEAMSRGNPVITTGWSGNMEYCTDDNSYLVNAPLTPVRNMREGQSWYTGDQMWAEPDLGHAKQLMRRALNNRAEANAKGRVARRDMLKYRPERIGELMKSELKKLL